MFFIHKSRTKASSRHQMQIKEIRDNILILPHHQYRMILETTSVNFELKSEAEQDLLIDNFQSFLNALTVPIQVVIRVREVDIDQYLTTLKNSLSQANALQTEQLTHYTQFIRSLVTDNKILSRRFYLVIPYSSSQKDFHMIKEQLIATKDIVARGLEKLGLKTHTLNTLDILNLFYSFYSPTQVKIQPLLEKSIIT